ALFFLRNPNKTGWRRGSESNRRIRLLQSPALPLGYPAVTCDAQHNAVLLRCKFLFPAARGAPVKRSPHTVAGHVDPATHAPFFLLSRFTRFPSIIQARGRV